ncbi:uncharacterized protein TRUGW13939_01071 [Talaromyces rugulosus]|uniref:Uncharacterized protein n=1 Tax=Talaromyces rugulosus TaxID=121627 RepID=A0A7H8QJ66_TALRU|nr:uncharacterized protein TRUGW13939_01071 [Talaromyces rugulosus]QKX53990.1 hypothetical protein TRUGW13939_01071 [Talaromyces rugulosus]
MALPRETICDIFGDDTTPSLGLNILPPFSRDQKANKTRAKAARRKRSANILPGWSEEDYRKALVDSLQSLPDGDAITPPIIFSTAMVVNVEELLRNVATSLCLPTDKNSLVIPCRPFGARIGVILNRSSVDKGRNGTNIEKRVSAIPEVFLDADITPEKAMISTADLHQCFSLWRSSPRESWPQDGITTLSAFHRAFIDNSNLRVVLLCGKNAQSVCRPANGDKVVIKFRHWKNCDWKRIKEWSELLRFIAKITGMKDVRARANMMRSIAREIILRYVQERNGEVEAITLGTMDARNFKKDLWPRVCFFSCTLPPSEYKRSGSAGGLLRHYPGASKSREKAFSKEALVESRSLYTHYTGRQYKTVGTATDGNTDDTSDIDSEYLDEIIDVSMDNTHPKASEDDDPRPENLGSMSSGNFYHVENPYADVEVNYQSSLPQALSSLLRAPPSKLRDARFYTPKPA